MSYHSWWRARTPTKSPVNHAKALGLYPKRILTGNERPEALCCASMSLCQWHCRKPPGKACFVDVCRVTSNAPADMGRTREHLACSVRPADQLQHSVAFWYVQYSCLLELQYDRLKVGSSERLKMAVLVLNIASSVPCCLPLLWSPALTAAVMIAANTDCMPAHVNYSHLA